MLILPVARRQGFRKSNATLADNMIEPQTQLTIHYPISSHIRNKWAMRSRHITVASVRDLVKQPLTAGEFMRRPYIHRSRWLAKAWDIELSAWRQFYLGTSEEFAAPGVLRAGAFDSETQRLIRLIGREYQPTMLDRRALMRSIDKFQMRLSESETLGIFAPDLQFVSSDS